MASYPRSETVRGNSNLKPSLRSVNFEADEDFVGGLKAIDRFNVKNKKYDRATLKKLASDYNNNIFIKPTEAFGKNFDDSTENYIYKIWLFIFTMIIILILAVISFVELDQVKTFKEDYYLLLAIVILSSLSIGSFMLLLFNRPRLYTILIYISIITLGSISYYRLTDTSVYDKDTNNTSAYLGLSAAVVSIIVLVVLLFYYREHDKEFNPELESYKRKDMEERKIKSLSEKIRKEQLNAVQEAQKKWKTMKLSEEEKNKVIIEAVKNFTASIKKPPAAPAPQPAPQTVISP